MRNDIIITQKLIAAYQDIQKRNPPIIKGMEGSKCKTAAFFAYMAKTTSNNTYTHHQHRGNDYVGNTPEQIAVVQQAYVHHWRTLSDAAAEG